MKARRPRALIERAGTPGGGSITLGLHFVGSGAGVRTCRPKIKSKKSLQIDLTLAAWWVFPVLPRRLLPAERLDKTASVENPVSPWRLALFIRSTICCGDDWRSSNGAAMRLWPLVLFALGVGAIFVPVRSPHATPYDDADAAIARDEEDRALAILLPLAERGEAQAQYRVGQIYYLFKKRDVEALKWIRRATDQGHASAMYTLANMNHNGNVVPRNLVQAYRWYALAAERAGSDSGLKDRALSNRDLVAKIMTGGQIDDAKKLAAAFAPARGVSEQVEPAPVGTPAPNAPVPVPRPKFALPMTIAPGDVRFECTNERHPTTYLIEVNVAKSQVRQWARFDDGGNTNGPFGPYAVTIAADKLTWILRQSVGKESSVTTYVLERASRILTIESMKSWEDKPFIDRTKPCISAKGVG